MKKKPKKYYSEKTKMCGRSKMDELDKKDKFQLYFVNRDIKNRGGREVVESKLKEAFHALPIVSE